MIGDPTTFLIGSLFLIPALFIAIPIHELGHGWTATWLGDPTPRIRGGLRFHPPQQFFNVYGVVAVFLANVGWGTPIPINEHRLSAARRVGWALGGPIANLVTAAIFGIVLRLLVSMGFGQLDLNFIQPPQNYLVDLIYGIFFLNLALFAFQLLPVPGLDGWRVVEVLFRSRHPRFFFDVSSNLQTIWIVAVLIVVGAEWLLHLDLLSWAVAIFFEPASLAILGGCAGYVALHPCVF